MGGFEFNAYDGFGNNQYDGNPDRLEIKVRGITIPFDQPDGMEPPKQWPRNVIHQNAKFISQDLRDYLVREFDYYLPFEQEQ